MQVTESECGSEDDYQEELGVLEECNTTNEDDNDNLHSLEARRRPLMVDVKIEGQPMKWS
jgi:hypothetical protein